MVLVIGAGYTVGTASKNLRVAGRKCHCTVSSWRRKRYIWWGGNATAQFHHGGVNVTYGGEEIPFHYWGRGWPWWYNITCGEGGNVYTELLGTDFMAVCNRKCQ